MSTENALARALLGWAERLGGLLLRQGVGMGKDRG